MVRAELSRLARDMERYYPSCQTTVVLGEMPFEEEEEVSSFGSYFDRATFSVKNEGEKKKRIKRDLMTSIATTLRSIERQKPTIVVGDGPGAPVALGLPRPELQELVPQQRNLQQVEIEKMAPHWANVLMIVCRKPCLTKGSLDVDYLDQTFPLMFQTGEVEPDTPVVGIGRSDAVNSGVAFRDKAADLFERAGAARYSDLRDVDWKKEC